MFNDIMMHMYQNEQYLIQLVMIYKLHAAISAPETRLKFAVANKLKAATCSPSLHKHSFWGAFVYLLYV